MIAPRPLLWLPVLALASRALADAISPAVPGIIGPDGNCTRGMMFTTKAYQTEALRLLLQEASRVAEQLRLPEQLPITESNALKTFINPFGYACARKAIGNVTTTNYTYYVSQGNKFSYLEGTHQDADCRGYQRRYTWPLSRVDTNQAYQLATQWLAAVSMDVSALNRDCAVVTRPETDYIQPPRGTFVPVYYVSWRKRDGDHRSVADVRLFTPTRTLLQLRVEDPKYILRAPLLFTNLRSLLSQTNAPRPPSATPFR